MAGGHLSPYELSAPATSLKPRREDKAPTWGFGLAGGALSSPRGFGLVAGALDLWLGLCLLIGALDLWVGLRTRIEEGGLRPRFFE